MPDYSQGKIYCIRAPGTNDIYIGSTTRSLCERFGEHRRAFRRWKSKAVRYTTVYKLLENPNAYIELVEDYPCDNKEQLNRREGEVIRAQTSCVNKCLVGRTDAEYREDNREKIHKYYTDNREKILTRLSVYYENNRDKITESQRKYRQAKRAIKVDAATTTSVETAMGAPEETNTIVESGQ